MHHLEWPLSEIEGFLSQTVVNIRPVSLHIVFCLCGRVRIESKIKFKIWNNRPYVSSDYRNRDVHFCPTSEPEVWQRHISSFHELRQWRGVRCLSVNFCANRFFSQANGRITTKFRRKFTPAFSSTTWTVCQRLWSHPTSWRYKN